MSATLSFFATTAKGMEALLATELGALGAVSVEPRRAGVSFKGPLAMAYRACLWSRVANRVLLPLASFRAETPQALYEGVRRVRWSDHLGARDTLAVDFSATRSTINHSHYGALRTKDAIVDQFRDRTGSRPSVDVARPRVRVNVYLHEDRAVVSIDLSGESLHRRSYRQRGVAAPLKENLAASILLIAEWPRLARARVPFIDPMSGSGTLPIEAALIAADVAPGCGRAYFGFLGWHGHDAAVWARLLREAEERRIRDAKRLPVIRGFDVAAAAVRTALVNVERAGLRGMVHVERRGLADCEPIAARLDGTCSGLLVTNPPYGERVGDRDALAPLYATLGDTLRRRFMGWNAYVLTGNPDLARHIGLRATRRHILYNGAIECRLLELPISPNPVRQQEGPRWRREEIQSPTSNVQDPKSRVTRPGARRSAGADADRLHPAAGDRVRLR